MIELSRITEAHELSAIFVTIINTAKSNLDPQNHKKYFVLCTSNFVLPTSYFKAIPVPAVLFPVPCN